MAAKKTTKTAATKTAKKPAGKAAKTKKPAGKKPPAKGTIGVNLDDILNEDSSQTVTFRRKFTDEEAEKMHGANVLSVRESLHKLNTKTTKRPVNLYTPGMLRKVVMPFEHLTMQYAIGSIGVRYPAVIQLIGPESSGKTSFCLHWAGRLLARGCPVIFIDCEDKPQTERRAARILDRDPRRAKLFFNSIYWSKATQLVEFDEVVRQTVEQARINCDKNPATKGNPIYVFGDTWTTLMAAGEAQGRSDWGIGTGAGAKKKALKDTGTGSNFGHSKHAQGMKRWLPHFLRKYNATLVLAMHQNENISMSPGAPPVPKYKNTTTTGQRGLAQISSYIFVMTPSGDIQATDKTVTGFNIRFFVAKSSYGPRNRSFYASLSFDGAVDTPTHYEDPFSYGEKTAEWMAQRGLLGVRLTNRKYTCDVLGCTAVTGDELYARLLASPEQLDFLGAALQIEGYDTTTEQARAAAMSGIAPAPPSEDPCEEEGDDDDDEESPTTEDDEEVEE